MLGAADARAALSCYSLRRSCLRRTSLRLLLLQIGPSARYTFQRPGLRLLTLGLRLVAIPRLCHSWLLLIADRSFGRMSFQNTVLEAAVAWAALGCCNQAATCAAPGCCTLACFSLRLVADGPFGKALLEVRLLWANIDAWAALTAFSLDCFGLHSLRLDVDQPFEQISS